MFERGQPMGKSISATVRNDALHGKSSCTWLCCLFRLISISKYSSCATALLAAVQCTVAADIFTIRFYRCHLVSCSEWRKAHWKGKDTGRVVAAVYIFIQYLLERVHSPPYSSPIPKECKNAFRLWRHPKNRVLRLRILAKTYPAHSHASGWGMRQIVTERAWSSKLYAFHSDGAKCHSFRSTFRAAWPTECSCRYRYQVDRHW